MKNKSLALAAAILLSAGIAFAFSKSDNCCNPYHASRQYRRCHGGLLRHALSGRELPAFVLRQVNL